MPDLDDELEGAGDEEVRAEGVPLDAVDGRGVGGVGHEVLGAVLLRGEDHRALLRTHQEHVLVTVHQF